MKHSVTTLAKFLFGKAAGYAKNNVSRSHASF
jgi:hypothetical protein